MILTLAIREVRSLFLSPLAWTILAVVQFILGFIFLSRVELFIKSQSQLVGLDSAYGITDIIVSPLFGNIITIIVLLLVIPLLTMRLLSEELRSQTISLLFSAPISMTEIVLGKYLGIMIFLAIMLGMIAIMPLSLLIGGSLDYGMFLSCLMAMILFLGVFAAVGLFMSSLTNQPIIAAISAFAVLLMLLIIGSTTSVPDTGQDINISSLFAYLSLHGHFVSLLQGVFSSYDIAYFLLLIITFLVLTIRRMDAYRLQH